jgi:polyferredoxin
MDSNFLPLWKAVDAPIMSLDKSHVELFSVLALFLLALVALVAPKRQRQRNFRSVQTISVFAFSIVVYSCLGIFGVIRNEYFFWMSLLLNVIAFSIIARVVFKRLRQGNLPSVQTISVFAFSFIVYLCLGIFGMIRNANHGTNLIESIFTESFFWMNLPLTVIAFSIIALITPRQWIRHLVQTLSVLVFFYIVYSCLGVFGMIRNVMHGTTLIGTIFTESFFWMSLPLTVIAFSITSGPYFCGWICPTGTFQELVASIRERISNKLNPKNNEIHKVKLSKTNLILLATFFIGFLGLVFWLGSTKEFYVEDSSLHWAAALILLVFLVVTRNIDDAAIRGIRGISFIIIVVSALLKTAIISPVHFAFADVSDPASALTTLVLVVASLFISRAWCRYICPWGYLMGCLHRVSRLKVVASTDCNQCGQCEQSCRVGAIRNGKVETAECQFCLKCIDNCPTSALEIVDVWKKDRQS